MVYLKVSAVRAAIRKRGKRAGKDFLLALDRQVEQLIDRSASNHNGGRKTLDAAALQVASGRV